MAKLISLSRSDCTLQAEVSWQAEVSLQAEVSQLQPVLAYTNITSNVLKQSHNRKQLTTFKVFSLYFLLGMGAPEIFGLVMVRVTAVQVEFPKRPSKTFHFAVFLAMNTENRPFHGFFQPLKTTS